ncbi:hypothetical protein ACFQ4C_17940 [Larkinella insperata]|uniref:Uncharacterized protein n=1 Tax=Larkinella insperata TaxID=332158 RepID=A0ABW3QFI4_9BACT|nr:hypothetical protein [Larkinella insperata]
MNVTEILEEYADNALAGWTLGELMGGDVVLRERHEELQAKVPKTDLEYEEMSQITTVLDHMATIYEDLSPWMQEESTY